MEKAQPIRIMLGSLVTALLCFTTISSGLSEPYGDVDSRCTNIRSGLPSCNFNRENCFTEKDTATNGKGPGWTYVKDGQGGPVEPHERGYVYLDAGISQGEPRMMSASIASNKKAICALFYYASTGSSEIPINIYIQNTAEEMHLVHSVMAQTNGEWEKSDFSCCLPNLNDSKLIGIEAASSQDGTVAIDYVDIRLSNMPCENGELVCYPSMPSKTVIDPVNAPTCAAGSEKIDTLSCDFDSKNKTSPEYCGWATESGWVARHKFDSTGIYDIIHAGWEARQKWDGTGTYDIIYANQKDAILVQTIPDEIEALCVVVQFSSSVSDTDLDNVFTVHLRTQDGLDVLWGASYNYNNSQVSSWKRNSFNGHLPDAKNRQIKLIARKPGLKVDYIHVRTSSKTYPTKPPAESEWETVFSCTNPSEVEEKCDMQLGSKWTVSNESQGLLPARSNFYFYNGAPMGSGTQPVLSTGFIQSDNHTLITFSYATAGDADIAVIVETEPQRQHYIWSTSSSTGGKWNTKQVSINVIGKFKVEFYVIQNFYSAKVGIADILVTEPRTKLPEVTTGQPSEQDETTEQQTKLYETTEQPSELNATTEQPSEVNITTEQPTEQNQTTEQPSELDNTTEKPSGQNDTTKQPSELDNTTGQPSGQNDTTEQPSEVNVTTEQPKEQNQTTEQLSELDNTAEQPSGQNDTTEQPSELDSTTEQPSELDGTTEQPSELYDTTEQPSELDNTTEQQSELDDTTEQPSELDDTTEQPSELDDTTEQSLGQNDTTEQPSELDDTTEQSLELDDTTKQPSELDDTTEQPSGQNDTTEQPSEQDDTTQQPKEQNDTTEQPSELDNTTESQGQDETTEKPSEREETTEQPPQPKQTTKKPKAPTTRPTDKPKEKPTSTKGITLPGDKENQAANSESEDSWIAGGQTFLLIIVGSTLGAILFVGLAGGLVWCLFCRRRKGAALKSRYIQAYEMGPSSAEPRVFENALYSE